MLNELEHFPSKLGNSNKFSYFGLLNVTLDCNKQCIAMSWIIISRYAVGRMLLQNSAVHLPHYRPYYESYYYRLWESYKIICNLRVKCSVAGSVT
jgi:hypothetical protein